MYHITSRANHKDRYLESAIAKDLFIEQLARMREKHDCEIIDFMVMNNHIHLVLQPLKDSNLSACMQWLLGVYSMNYNRVFTTWGSVWGSRYFSRPIIGLGDLIHTIEYIDANPVRACLIDRSESWKWGGLYYHRNCRDDIIGPPPPWLTLVAPTHRRISLGSDPHLLGSDPSDHPPLDTVPPQMLLFRYYE